MSIDRTEFHAYSGYIFDFDGTLADTMGVWRTLVERYLVEKGFSLSEERMREVMNTTSRHGLEGGGRIVFGQLGITDDPHEIALRWTRECVAEYENNVSLKPSALELLQQLKAKGKKLAIATSGGPTPLNAALRKNGCDHLFDAIVCAAEVTDQGKRVPDVFLESARRLGCTVEDCVVLEDIADNARVASAAGFAVIGVKDEGAQQNEAQLRSIADGFVMSFDELI